MALLPTTSPGVMRTVPPSGPLLPPGGLLLGLTDATSNAGGFSVDGGTCFCAAQAAIPAIASRSFLDISVSYECICSIIVHMTSKLWIPSLLCASLAWAQPANRVGIAHVAFRVADLEAARGFYNKLGFEQFFAMQQGERTTEAFLKINDHQFIELYPQADDADARTR